MEYRSKKQSSSYKYGFRIFENIFGRFFLITRRWAGNTGVR